MAPETFALRGRFVEQPGETGVAREPSAPQALPSWWARSWRTMLREPLLHFVVLGGLIFAADAVMHPPARDERVITVTKARIQSFIENYDEDKGRRPTDAELKAMVDAWVASEILTIF